MLVLILMTIIDKGQITSTRVVTIVYTLQGGKLIRKHFNRTNHESSLTRRN